MILNALHGVDVLIFHKLSGCIQTDWNQYQFKAMARFLIGEAFGNV